MTTWRRKVWDWEGQARMANYSSSELAMLCGISQRHLQRYFHDAFGLELRRWLNGLRLKDASHLLGTKTVKEVAIFFGFKQSNHFSREFKKFSGMTPGMFLRTNPRQNPQVEIEILRMRDYKARAISSACRV